MNDKNDHELTVQAQVEKAVSEALQNVKVGDSTNDTRLKTNGDSHAFDIGRIIAQVITAIEPLLMTAVVNVTEIAMSGARCDTECLDKIKKQTQLQHFKLDELEQYTRKENIPIHGLPETGGNEDTADEVVKLARKAGVTITKNDISVAHRLPGNRSSGKPRSIIAKFVRRIIKTDFMRKKSNLRSDSGPRVFVTGDLTKMRAKLLYELKQDDEIDRAYSLDCSV